MNGTRFHPTRSGKIGLAVGSVLIVAALGLTSVMLFGGPDNAVGRANALIPLLYGIGLAGVLWGIRSGYRAR